MVKATLQVLERENCQALVLGPYDYSVIAPHTNLPCYVLHPDLQEFLLLYPQIRGCKNPAVICPTTDILDLSVFEVCFGVKYHIYYYEDLRKIEYLLEDVKRRGHQVVIGSNIIFNTAKRLGLNVYYYFSQKSVEDGIRNAEQIIQNLAREMYGDNVIEKHGINRDRTGDREKTRYLCGKQGIFTRDRALIRPGFIRQLETRASTRSASFFHALGSPGRPHNGGGAAGAYRTSNGAKPLKQGHLRAKRGPLGPSRKSQQQTKRTGFAAHGHSIAETAPEGKRASCANGALNRAKINGWGQKQGFGGSDRRAGSVTSRYSRRYDGGGDRAQAQQNSPFAKGHFRQSRGDVSLCPYFLGFRGVRAVWARRSKGTAF